MEVMEWGVSSRSSCLPLSFHIKCCFTILALLALACLRAYLWYLGRVARSKQLPFPSIPYAIPNPHWLLGHLKLLGAGIVDGQRRFAVDYAGGDKLVSTCFMFRMPTFTTLDAELMNRILRVTSERKGPKRHVLHFRRLFGNQTILMQNGSEWKESRARLHRALHSYDLVQLQRLLCEASWRLEKCLHNEISNSPAKVWKVDAVEFFRMATLDVVGLSVFGHDFGCCNVRESRFHPEVPLLRTTQFLQRELTRRAFEHRLSMFAQFYWLPSPANRKHATERVRFRTMMKRAVQNRRRHPPPNAESRQFIDCILEQTSSSAEGAERTASMNDDELADWLQTTLIGGFDTTAVALASTVYLLCKHPHLQEECRKEARQAMDSNNKKGRKNECDDNGGKQVDATNDLPLITACFYEALRLYPPATVTTRNLTRPFEFELDGQKVTLEKDTRIVAPFYWINRAELNFSRPNEFLPTRWAQQRATDGKWERRTPQNDLGGGGVEVGKQSSCLSFSAGARDCVGRSLAMRMAPTMIGALLTTASFELEDKWYEIELERFGGNAVAKGGVPVRVSMAK